MKKMLSVLLAMVMAFTCMFSAASLAETAEADALREEELDAVLTWLLDGITEENASELLTWDQDTILKKLEDYDKPLEYYTKEEIAQYVSVVLEIIGQFVTYEEGGGEDAFTRSGGGEMDLSGLLSLFGGMMGVGDDTQASGGIDLTGLLPLFGSMIGGEADAQDSGEDETDSSGFLSLFGGMMGGEEEAQDYGEDEMDLSGLLSLFGGMMGGEEDTQDGGEDETDMSGLISLLGGMMGGEEDAQDGGEDETDMSGLISLLGGMMGGEDAQDGGEDETDLSGLISLLGGMMGGEDAQDGGEDETDLSGLLSLFGGLLGGSDDADDWYFEQGDDRGDEWSSEWSDEDEGEVIDGNFDGSHWISGDITLYTVYQDGYYRIVITRGDIELCYQCENDPETREKVSAGTGDPTRDEIQPDHGVARFFLSEDGSLIWVRPDGGETAFTLYTDPLHGTGWFAGEKELTIYWLGELNYEVDITDNVNYYWYYECVLDEETDTLEGIGEKGAYEGDAIYTDAQALFAFQRDRTELVWLDEKEEDALDGLTFEAVDPLLVHEFWDSDDYGIFITWTGGYYNVILHNYANEAEYGYLCTYDRENGILTAVDPAAVDFDFVNPFGDREIYFSIAAFVLVDDSHMVWLDGSGLSGDGYVLERMVWD